MPLSPANSAGALSAHNVIPGTRATEVEATTQPAQPQTVENRYSASMPATTLDKAASARMFKLAVEQGCYRVGAGESVRAVMEELGIAPGTSAERLLYTHSGQKPPSRVQASLNSAPHNRDFRAAASIQPEAKHSPPPTADTPHHVLPALPTPQSDLLPFPIRIVRREPHPGRDPGAEAWLTGKCEKVAGGVDYQTFIDEIGDPTPNSDYDPEDDYPQVKSVNLDVKALHDQAMGSAKHAILGGKSLPATAAYFSIKEESDLENLAMFAAREVGAPHVREGECFIKVRNALGIGAYDLAVQKLVDAMPPTDVRNPLIPPHAVKESSSGPFIPSDPVARKRALDAMQAEGLTCMEAALRFDIQPDSDAYGVLTISAAKDIGKPRVLAGEDVLNVANALGIATVRNAQLILESAKEQRDGSNDM